MKKETAAIHKGLHIDNQYGSVTPPIYTASTFEIDHKGQNQSGITYSRYSNPTRQALSDTLAELENGTNAAITSSGMSAIVLISYLLSTGDHILTSRNLYGGTYAFFHDIIQKFGIEVTMLDDLNDLESVKSAIKSNTKLIWLETPSNPLFRIVDIQAVSKLAKEVNPNILIAADNTFMTPVCQKPLDLGCDIVMHSTTKCINGHSDVIGGAVITRDPELGEEINNYNALLGFGAAPFDSWLVLRGVKTLYSRMKQHEENAMAIAEYLEQSQYSKEVFYPGLKSHPQYDLIQSQMSGPGGILSFKLDLDKVNLEQFFNNLNLYTVALSLGGVESLISQPWCMSHSKMSPECKLKAGIDESIIRISVGIENKDDLIEDLEQAFQKSTK